MDVTYVVEGDGSSLSITISPPPGMGASGFSVDDIEVHEDGISFSFMPGPLVECELEAQDDGSYATIANPDLIEIGWKMCIPSAADAQAMMDKMMMVMEHVI